MTEMPDFDAPLMAFAERLHQAEFSEDEISEASAALGQFTGEAFNIIQAHIHTMVDRLGMRATDAFAKETVEDDWYKGFLSGIVVSLQVILYGDEHTEQMLASGIIPKLRQGMDALLDQNEDQLPPEVRRLIQAIKDGEEPSEEIVRAASLASMMP